MTGEVRGERNQVGDAIVELETLIAERTIGSIGFGMEVAQRQVKELEGVADALSEAIAERDLELERLRAENVELRERNATIYESLADAADEVEVLRSDARGQATKIRMQALRHAVRFAGRRPEDDEQPPLLDDDAAAVAAAAGEDLPGFAEAPAGVTPGMLQIELGPLGDFDQLLGAEKAIAAIAAVSSAQVRRFSRGRATLAIELSADLTPEALLDALEEAEPTIRDSSETEIVVDLAGTDVGRDVA